MVEGELDRDLFLAIFLVYLLILVVSDINAQKHRKFQDENIPPDQRQNLSVQEQKLGSKGSYRQLRHMPFVCPNYP